MAEKNLGQVLDELYESLKKKGCLPAGVEKNTLMKEILHSLEQLKINPMQVQDTKETRFFLMNILVAAAWLKPGCPIPKNLFNDNLRKLANLVMTPQDKLTLEESQRNLAKLKITIFDKIKELKNSPKLKPEGKKALNEIEKRLEESAAQLSKNKQAMPAGANAATMRLFLDSLTLALIDYYNQDPRTGQYQSAVDHVVADAGNIMVFNPENKNNPVTMANDPEEKHEFKSPFNTRLRPPGAQ